jgi:hypothetical protein
MAEEISKRTVVYSMPGADDVTIRRDGALDVYEAKDARAAMVIVAGYPDEGFERIVGCPFREMGSTVSWGRLIAASGVTAVAYSNRGIGLPQVAAAVRDMGFHRVGLFATSGNAPSALPLLMRDATVRVDSAVLCYPYTLKVPAEAKRFGFATPADERPSSDMAGDIPIFIARAGQDEMPGLNRTLDEFIGGALAANLPVTLVNHSNAPHAFDLFDDTAATRRVIATILGFIAGN